MYRRPTPPAPPAITPGVLSYGVMGTIASVPKGFSLDVILSVGAGPNDAVRGWGKKMTTAYNKTNPRNKDFTTTHLGYDTDSKQDFALPSPPHAGLIHAWLIP